jgi:hypothetical protein
VKARPDATLEELRTWLLETHKVSASTTLMWETLGQLRLTLKKDPACGGAEPARRAQARKEWQGRWRNSEVPPRL